MTWHLVRHFIEAHTWPKPRFKGYGSLGANNYSGSRLQTKRSALNIKLIFDDYIKRLHIWQKLSEYYRQTLCQYSFRLNENIERCLYLHNKP